MPAHYGKRWFDLRRKFITYNPTCERCGKPATDVDHIKDVKHHPELMLSWGNLRSMCHSCHSKRTSNDQIHIDKTSPCDVNGYPTDPEHPWNVLKK